MIMLIYQAIKKVFSFLGAPFFLLVLDLSIDSCVKSNEIERKSIVSFSLETKAGGGVFNEYQVTDNDIANYVSFKSLDGLSRNGKTIVKEVLPIKWQDVTCLYVVQYEKGYEVISADKRSPLPLMKDDNGTFDSPGEDTPFGFHLYTLAEDVWSLSYDNVSLGEPDKEAIANMELSLLFWKLISADYKTIDTESSKTKGSRDTIILDPDSGHWELISTTSQTEVYDTSAHLTSTWWHQFYPFNAYCPYETFLDLDRCPAGCVAIAGAQMLYFLHYKIGIPEESPATGSCTGYVRPILPSDSVYTQSFGNYSSNTWNYMQAHTDPSSTRYAAKLIGDIGKKVNMQYSNNGSGATLAALRDNAFHDYGIKCATLNNYNGNFMKDNLSRGYPVLCSGIHLDINAMGDTINKIGHAFLVDRYIRSRIKITFTYEWVFDDPGQSSGYQIIKRTIVYDTPYVTMYQMNWGQGYNYNYNDVWCGMNGIWQYGDLSYVHNRRMLVNFSALEE